MRWLVGASCAALELELAAGVSVLTKLTEQLGLLGRCCHLQCMHASPFDLWMKDA